jgi:hypothetical protein
MFAAGSIGGILGYCSAQNDWTVDYLNTTSNVVRKKELNSLGSREF